MSRSLDNGFQPVRRSQRSTRGVGPTRYGDWETNVVVDSQDGGRENPVSRANRKQLSEDNGKRPRAGSSRRSIGSKRSSTVSRESEARRRALKAEIDADQATASLDKQLAQAQLDKLRLEVALREEEINLRRQLCEQELHIRERENLAEKSLINKRLDLQKQVIREECDLVSEINSTGSETSSVVTGYDSVDDESKVHNWLCDTPHPKHSTPIQNQQHTGVNSLGGNNVKHVMPRSNCQVNQTVSANASANTSVDQLANALIQAVHSVPKTTHTK